MIEFSFQCIHVVHSFTELVPVLLSNDGGKYILSERFNQDRLEAFFGQQWARGRRNTNPTVVQHLYNTNAIRIAKSLASGNSSNIMEQKRKLDESDYREQSSPLPKRKRKSSASAKPRVLYVD